MTVMTIAKAFILVVLVLLFGAALLIWSGSYNVAADVPHLEVTRWVLDTLRERSIEGRAQENTPPPNLDETGRVAKGAELYAEMCAGCHLAPGTSDSELRDGLYPRPPKYAQGDEGWDPGLAFWVIKHGIKLTAMPAWGKSHTDEEIWNMVAFLGKLPNMSDEQYRSLTSHVHQSDHEHSHQGRKNH
jgi:mono/diheme cytochrome c family protein